MEYLASIIAIQPNAGSVHGGSTLSIIGTGFPTDKTDISVTVGGVKCTVLAALPNKLTCRLATRLDGSKPNHAGLRGVTHRRGSSITVLNDFYIPACPPGFHGPRNDGCCVTGGGSSRRRRRRRRRSTTTAATRSTCSSWSPLMQFKSSWRSSESTIGARLKLSAKSSLSVLGHHCSPHYSCTCCAPSGYAYTTGKDATALDNSTRAAWTVQWAEGDILSSVYVAPLTSNVSTFV